jgi:hypothetical protein
MLQFSESKQLIIIDHFMSTRNHYFLRVVRPIRQNDGAGIGAATPVQPV